MAIKNVLKLKFVTNCGLQIMQQIFKQYFKKHRLIYRAVVIIVVFIIVVFVVLSLLDSYIDNFSFNKSEVTLVNVVSGVIAVIGLVLFFRRVKHQEKQVDIQNKQLNQQQKQVNLQIEQRVDERFTTAVNLLGSSETSARTGGIYSLFHLALDEKKYRKEIAQILCSHIRSKTEEKDYQKTYKKKPSNEIQTTINLLFKTNGLYHKFNKELEPANLRHAFLAGADFSGAHCQEANFWGAQVSRNRVFGSSMSSGRFFACSMSRGKFLVCSMSRGRFYGCRVSRGKGSMPRGIFLQSVKGQIFGMLNVKGQIFQILNVKGLIVKIQ